MNTAHAISLSPLDLGVAALLVLLLAFLTARRRLGIARQLIISAVRMTVQLLLIGLVLRTLFSHVALGWVALIGTVMLLIAAREVMARQNRRFTGWWGFGVGAGSMFISSFAITILTLVVIVGPDPWYTPRYAVPLLGMLLGNTMNGISLALDRLTESAWEQRRTIEQRLILGQKPPEAMETIFRQSMRTALTPIINSMAAAGIVSLPGMMTGQILAGNLPLDAVRYQILIMFMVSAGTGFGTLAAVWMTSHRLFDDRDRLRLDRLKT